MFSMIQNLSALKGLTSVRTSVHAKNFQDFSGITCSITCRMIQCIKLLLRPVMKSVYVYLNLKSGFECSVS